MIRKISEEKRQTIKEKSAFTLPIRPSENGMSPEQVKKAFYGFVTGQTDTVIQEINRIVDEMNGELGGRHWFAANEDVWIREGATIENPCIFNLGSLVEPDAEIRNGDFIVAEVSTSSGDVEGATGRIGFAKIIEVFEDEDDIYNGPKKAKYWFVGYFTGNGITNIDTEYADIGYTTIVISTHKGSYSFRVNDGRPIFYTSVPIKSSEPVYIDNEDVLPQIPKLQLDDLVLGSNGLLGRITGRNAEKMLEITSLFSLIGPEGKPGEAALTCRALIEFEEGNIAIERSQFSREPKVGEVFVVSSTKGTEAGLGTYEICEVADGVVTIAGLHFLDCRGKEGKQGAPFKIAKTFISIAAMNAGYATDGVDLGCFVAINTGNVEDDDNAKLFYKGDSKYEYIVDMSGLPGIHGADGRGVADIKLVKTVGLAKTYRITFTDNSTPFEFVVYNGSNGSDGDDGITPHIGDDGYWYIGETKTPYKAVGEDADSPFETDEDGFVYQKNIDWED